MADTEGPSRELFHSDEESPRNRNETISGGVKVTKEDRFGDALVIEDYESGLPASLQGKGHEIELLPRGKFAIDEEALVDIAEEEESRKARDSHQMKPVQFNLPGTYCDHCGTLIWGLTGKQGLKCDVCNYVCHIDCETKLTKRCRGYKSKIPDDEEEVSNVDKDIDFYDDLKNIGSHQFYPKMARRNHCNVCRQSVNLVGKQGLRCAICRYVVHGGCAKDAERNCPIPYHVPDTRKEKLPKHHWIEGNVESGGICIYCAKAVRGGSGLTNFQCYWCKGLIHNSCKDKHHKCDLGQHHNLKLPPHVFERNKDETDPHKWLVDPSMVPEDHCKRPLCVLINRMSGARQGASVIRQLSRLLNPMQIVDIAKGGPRFGIEMFAPLAKLPGGFCILGCGGDGTIGWICEELDKVGLPEEERPCVVPLPIGTGNDLSRVLGWGPGYEDEDLSKILDDIEVANVVYMDRWKINTYMTEENLKTAALVKSQSLPAIGHSALTKKEDAPEKEKEKGEEEGDDDEQVKEDKGKEKLQQEATTTTDEEKDDDILVDEPIQSGDFKGMHMVAEKIYNNYFSVGVDAKVALDFHIARESNPEGFKSRNFNKFKYFQYGAVSVIAGCKDLNKKIKVEVDGEELVIPNSVEGVVALNLTSYASGTNPWKNSKPAKEWSEQRFDDGIIEVVGVCGTIHLAQIRTGLSTGIQLGQGKRVIFTLTEALPVQADGEPWLQQPSIMEVVLHNKTKMLQRTQQASMLGQMLSPSTWFKKGRKKSSGTPRNEFGIDEPASEGGSTPSTPKKRKEASTKNEKGKEKEKNLEKEDSHSHQDSEEGSSKE